MATLEYKNSLSRYRRYLMNLQSQPIWNASFWVGLTIVLVILMVVFFLRPTLVVISGLMGQVREQKTLLDRMDQKITILRAAQKNLIQNQEGRNVLDKVLPETPMWKELAGTLYQIASDSGATINRVEIGNTALSGKKIEGDQVKTVTSETKDKLSQGSERITFRIEAVGEYRQLKEILTKLEKLGRMMVIENTRIAKNKDGLLDLNVSGFAAFFNYAKMEEP